MIPGGLDFLHALLDTGGILEHNGIKLNIANSIFVLISDVGADRIIQLLLKSTNRSSIPQQVLRNEVKSALDVELKHLNVGKFVDEVVPFLPLNPIGIQQILDSRLFSIRQELVRNGWCKEFIVEHRAISYLSGPQFIKYANHSIQQHKKNGPSSQFFAVRGARSILNAGPLSDLKRIISLNIEPWQPEKVLYVDVEYGDHGNSRAHDRNDKYNAGNINNLNRGITGLIQRRKLILAWCLPSLFVFDKRFEQFDVDSIIYDSFSIKQKVELDNGNVKEESNIGVDGPVVNTFQQEHSGKGYYDDIISRCDVIWNGYL